MKIKKHIFQMASLGTLLIGFLIISMLPQHLQVRCSKPKVIPSKLCRYGIYGIYTISRIRCSDEQPNNAICERIRTSFVHPSLKYSGIVVDPTGTYIQKSTLRSGTKGKRIPSLVIVNYKTGNKFSVTNYTGRGQDAIESLAKQFDLFLKKPDQQLFQISEEVPYPWIEAIPLTAIFVVTSFWFFKQSCESQGKK